MQILQILYIRRVVFWASGRILGGAMGHNATFGGMLYVFLLLIFLPLLPYFLYLLHNKIIQAKNALNRLFFYLTFFLCICIYCFVLFEFHSNNFLFYVGIIIVYAIIFVVIRRSKRSKNETSTK